MKKWSDMYRWLLEQQARWRSVQTADLANQLEALERQIAVIESRPKNKGRDSATKLLRKKVMLMKKPLSLF
jgi:hypothetical protein